MRNDEDIVGNEGAFGKYLMLRLMAAAGYALLTLRDRVIERRMAPSVREQIAKLRRQGATVSYIGDGTLPLFQVTDGGREALLYGPLLYGGWWRGTRFMPRYLQINLSSVVIVDGQPMYWACNDGWRVVHGNDEEKELWTQVTVRGLVNGRRLAYAWDGRRCAPYIGMTRLRETLPQVPFAQRTAGRRIHFDIADQDTGDTQTVSVLLAV